MTRVAVHSVSRVGRELEGPAIRAYQLARALGRELDVTLIAPGAKGTELNGLEPPTSRRALGDLLEAHDAVFAQKLPPRLMRRLAAGPRQVVYDLSTPSWLESLRVLRVADDRELAELGARTEALIQKLALATGNAFVCLDERQRDFWVGGLGALGRIGPQGYVTDPTFRELIDVVARPELVAPLVRLLTVPGRPVRTARAAAIELELAVLRARTSSRARRTRPRKARPRRRR